MWTAFSDHKLLSVMTFAQIFIWISVVFLDKHGRKQGNDTVLIYADSLKVIFNHVDKIPRLRKFKRAISVTHQLCFYVCVNPFSSLYITTKDFLIWWSSSSFLHTHSTK